MIRILASLLLVVGLGWSVSCAAASPDPGGGPNFPTEAQAQAACSAYLAWFVAPQPGGAGGSIGDQTCIRNLFNTLPTGSQGSWGIGGHGGAAGHSWGWKWPTPAQCAARPGVTGWIKSGSDVSVPATCSQGCEFYLQDGTSSGDGKGHNVSTGSFAPTGALCPAGGQEIGGGAGSPPTPKVCNGVSCYDPVSNTACAVVDGAQVCVSGPAGGATPPQGCSSSGSVALCVGSPAPSPPNPPVADPATEITGSDKITHQPHAPSGPVNNVTTNVFNSGSSPTNNGAGPVDVGSPSKDTAASGSGDGEGSGDPTNASGGGDCSSPPVCSGDNATCAVVGQVWLLRCPPGGGDADGGDGGDGDNVIPGLDSVGTVPGEGFITEQTVLDKLDVSGFGGGSVCPAFPAINIPMFHISVDAEAPLWWCQILDAAGGVILLLGAFTSLVILGRK